MAETIYESLPCPLTDDELAAKRDQIAASVRDAEEVETERREVAKELGDKLKNLGALAKRLAREINERSEHRQIKCRWKKNRTARRMELVRLDTGEIVRTRDMTVDEAQDRLPGMEPGDDDEASA